MAYRHFVSAVLFGAVLSGNHFAIAQDEPLQTLESEEAKTEAVAPEVAKRPTLDEIIVTAQKRAEDLQDVPLSVSAIGGEAMEQMNITEYGEMGALLPNTKFTSNGLKPNMRIRGLGSDPNRGFETSVGLYVDGIYFGRVDYLEGAFLDLERMEVLRGPQGTLFGKNNVAGAMNLSTRQAQLDEWEVRLDYLFGRFDHNRLRGVLNVPVWDGVAAIRVGGVYNDRSGFIYNTTRDRDEVDKVRTQYRAKLRIQPSDSIDLEFAYHTATYDRQGIGFQPYIYTDQTRALYTAFDPQADDDFEDYRIHEDHDSFFITSFDTYSAHLNWELSENTDFVYIASYSSLDTSTALDADFGPAPILTTLSDDTYTQWSHELRLQSSPMPLGTMGDFDYVAGLYAFGSTFDGYNFLTALTIEDTGQFIDQYVLPELLEGALAGIVPGVEIQTERLDATFDQETTSYAAFGQVNWRPTEKWTLIGGLRYSYEEKELDRVYDVQDVSVVFAVALGLEDYEAHRNKSEDDLSGKASVKYQITDDAMAYLTWAQGYKAGGYNANSSFEDQLEFDPEYSTTWEAGVKTEWWDRAMTVNVGLFRTEFEDLQVTHFTGDAFTVGNAATAISQGVEVELAYAPFLGTVVMVNGGWLDATYDKFDSAPCPADSDEDFCDLSGERLQRAPEWTAGLMAMHVNPLGNLPFDLVLGAEGSWQSDSFSSNDNDRRAIQEAHFDVGARIGFRDDEGVWKFVVQGKNLLANKVLVASADIPLQSGSFVGAVNDPRRVYVEFSVRW
ncbi:MAG: TonB-dependent receptor [Alphaproteobacteria bacterium]